MKIVENSKTVCEICKKKFINNTGLKITVCEKCRAKMGSTTTGV